MKQLRGDRGTRDKDEDEDDCYDEASSVDECFHTVKHPDLHRSSKVCTTASKLLPCGLQINQSNPRIDPPLWEWPVGVWEGLWACGRSL